MRLEERREVPKYIVPECYEVPRVTYVGSDTMLEYVGPIRLLSLEERTEVPVYIVLECQVPLE